MKRSLPLISLTVALFSFPATADHTPSWDAYEALAHKISKNIDTASLETLTADTTMLTRLSLKLLPAFIDKQPVCADYINAAMTAADTMLALSVEQIEEDYHADGKLPDMKEAICYHAKDLLVHPATMAVISKTRADNAETRDMLRDELEEVLEHFEEVKRDSGIK